MQKNSYEHRDHEVEPKTSNLAHTEKIPQPVVQEGIGLSNCSNSVVMKLLSKST